MDTERYCTSLDKLDRVQAIRAIHEAFLQLAALGDCSPYDNAPAMRSMADCLIAAGHMGFTEESSK